MSKKVLFIIMGVMAVILVGLIIAIFATGGVNL